MKLSASRKQRGLKTPVQASGEEPLSGAALARQWASVDLFSAALGGCICAGGFHVPIDRAAVALDLLTYLEDKYRSSDKAPLATFVAQGIAISRDFGEWLATLDSALLEPQDRALLMRDLKTTLDTMSGAGGFACT